MIEEEARQPTFTEAKVSQLQRALKLDVAVSLRLIEINVLEKPFPQEWIDAVSIVRQLVKRTIFSTVVDILSSNDRMAIFHATVLLRDFKTFNATRLLTYRVKPDSREDQLIERYIVEQQGNEYERNYLF